MRAILALAGPDVAPQLLAQIVNDLRETSRLLSLAIPAPDWAAIRAQSHVLVSVAGTIGAMDLHAAACHMNDTAHRQDRAELARISPPLLADLTELVGVVDAMRAAP